MLGPAAHDTVAAWGSDEVSQLQDNCHTTMAFQGTPVIVFKSSGLGAGARIRAKHRMLRMSFVEAGFPSRIQKRCF